MLARRTVNTRILMQRRKGAEMFLRFFFAALRLRVSDFSLVCIVTTLTTRHRVGAANGDTNTSPAHVTCVVGRTIRQTVCRSKVCDDLLIRAAEIPRLLD